jgi:hypothetical protein
MRFIGNRTCGVLFVAVALVCSVPASGDWDPGDGTKMHYPQLPDPNGWDVNWFTTGPLLLADDFRCEQTGPITDVHLWFSSLQDDHWNGSIVSVKLSIWSDIPASQSPSGYSMPGSPLWEYDATGVFTERLYGNGLQGWIEPGEPPIYLTDNHFDIRQLNVDPIDRPFIQQKGMIYWLAVELESFDAYHGWKTSLDHFNDGAVWGHKPQIGGLHPDWLQVLDPTGAPLDFAFVITPEPASLTLLGLAGLALMRRRRD